MGGQAPIVMGGMSDAEFTRQLERQAAANDEMLADAARRSADLQAELAEKDREMSTLLEQQARQNEIDLSAAQKKLNVELDALAETQSDDDLKADFSAIEAALAQGLGGKKSDSSTRPL